MLPSLIFLLIISLLMIREKTPKIRAVGVFSLIFNLLCLFFYVLTGGLR